MKRIIYALPSALRRKTTSGMPGMDRYIQFFKLYGNWTMPIDRTHTVKMPIRDVSLFPIPTMRRFNKTFEELCEERARKVLSDAEKLGTTMYVLYSGGIDSTCMLVSILKHATREHKKNMVILLTQDSIFENPHFYEDHIRGKLRVGSSHFFNELIGEDCYLLSAEHNDMVMGSEKIGKLMMKHGPDSIYLPFDNFMISNLFSDSFSNDSEMGKFYVELFERIAAASPVPIERNIDFLWWTNFAIKWQSCFHYILLFTPHRNKMKINQSYVDERFISFFNTEDFQLWSMNNLDKRIKDTWESYKWVAKDIIYAYTKDAEYRDHKVKKGSLLPLIGFDPPQRFILEDLTFSDDLLPEAYMNPQNDFV